MRTVYATVLEVQDEVEISATFGYVGQWISDWYRRRRVSFDDVLAELVTDDIEVSPIPGHKLSVKHHTASDLKGQSLVDLTWSHPDDYDKSLGWSTHLALLRTPSGLTLSLDVAVTGLSFRVAPTNIKLGSPRLARDVTRLKTVRLGGRTYNATPELVSADVVDSLCEDLADPARPHPIVLVSRRAVDDIPLVDAQQLAESLSGVAKVYELVDKWSAFRLTELLGKALSCYEGAVRIYWPRFSPQADPFVHPLWMPWQFADDGSADRSLRQVARTVFDAASFRHVEPHEMQALRRAAERDVRLAMRANAIDSADTDKLLEDLYKLEDKLKEAESQNDELAKECETLRANSMALASTASWNQEFQASPSNPPLPQPQTHTLIETVLDVVKVAKAKAKHLKFLPSALTSARDSPFKHPDRVLQALEAIDEVASIWVESLQSGKSVGSLRELFKSKYGFNYADDVSQTSKSKWAEEYKTSHDGKDYDISPHITIGGKQADTCLSIHWAWNKDLKKVMVAHVGRHKTNTKT